MSYNIQTIKDIRLYLTKELKEFIKEPEISAIANIVIKTVTGVTRLHQLNMPEYNITDYQAQRITEICNELRTGKPLQYILGETIFYDLPIKVTGATLIPRPETEELVDLIIKENKGFKGKVIDFGTGSGCIAIALAHNLPGAKITGIDISDEALTVAKENALLNKATVTLLKSDMLKFDYEAVNNTDIIVSNPPYVRESEKNYMNKNVIDFEPHLALFVSDSDPLVYYRSILNVAEKILRKGGKVYFEINEAMGKSMFELFESFGYSSVQVVHDINGKERIIKGKKDA
jgi:release factor glutamine methyltransferase